MANFTDWLYDGVKASPLGQRADANWERRQQGAGPAVHIPGVNWGAVDASRSPMGAAMSQTNLAPYGVSGVNAPEPVPLSMDHVLRMSSPSRLGGFAMADMASPQRGSPPPSQSALTPRSVQTYQVDSNGNPIMPSNGGGQQNANDETWQEKFTNVTGQPLTPAPQTGNLFDFLGGAFSTNSTAPPRTQLVTDQSRLPTDMGYMTGSAPGNQNPALAAIDLLTGSGGSTSFPRSPSFYRSPTAGAGGPTVGSAFAGGWGSGGFALPSMNASPVVDIGTVRGGGKTFPIPLTPSSKLRAGAPVAPRMASPPPLPASYKIKSGDTLTSLAKRFGTTVGQLANANGISNPNKIRAGSSLSLNFMAPPVPRTPPGGGPSPQASPAQQAAAKQSWDKYFNRDRQLAEGRSSQLDEFGNIR